MSSERGSSAGMRIHHELLRAHLETGFNLVHFAETASPASEAAAIGRALSDVHGSILESKRLLSLVDPAAIEDFRSELALLEFELHDLELESGKNSI
jgi:hypothetical protein